MDSLSKELQSSANITNYQRAIAVPAAENYPLLPTRVSRACERCRRNKSRCDQFRPCALCRRSNVECVSGPAGPERPQKKRRIEEPTRLNPAWSDPGRDETVAGQRLENRRDTDLYVTQPHDEENHKPETYSSTAGSRADGQNARSSSPRASTVNADLYEEQSDSPSAMQPTSWNIQEAESTMGITRKIFQLGSQSLGSLATSAMPDGDVSTEVSIPERVTQDWRPVSSVLECPLPSAEDMHLLLEEYFDSVHWFSLVIYEPRFRAQYNSIQGGFAHPSHKTFLLLLSTILGIAAWYRSKRPPSEIQRETADWSDWSSKLIKHTESRLFEIINEISIPTVQICILLASYNSYHGKPKSAFALLGATIKTAQAMGLHRESSREDFAASEERKRVWWTIYTWDRWASITYGRPLGIRDSDCNVSMPSDIYETRHFTSGGRAEDTTPICYSTYQRELNKLYMTASPLIENIFGTGSSNSNDSARRDHYAHMMTKVSRKLTYWRRLLPSHLVFDYDCDIQANAPPMLKAHRLQALALQLTFDCVIIILHRPFLTQQILGLSREPRDQAEECHDILSNQASPAFSADTHMSISPNMSRTPELPDSEKWWEAAVRTSRITGLPQLARLATDGHLVAFLAIVLFNSAIVMGVCALSDPLSDRAQEAKRNITRIYRLQCLLGRRSMLSQQSSSILQDVIRMIVLREASAMLMSVEPVKRTQDNFSANEQAIDTSTYVSVEDALRLPLTVPDHPADHSQMWSTSLENSAPMPETVRFSESLASVQKVLSGNAFTTPQYGDTFENEQLFHNHGAAPDTGGWRDNLQRCGSDFLAGNELNQYDAANDGLYWIWNNVYDADTMS